MTTQTTENTENTSTIGVSSWMRRGGPAVAAIAFVMYVTSYVHWPDLRMQVDAMVYRFAAERLLAGLDLYSTGLTGNHTELLFIYPPFAAVCAVPLALLDSSTVQWLWLLAMVAALAYAVVRMLKSMGMRAGGGLYALAPLLVGLTAWLEPVRLTAQLGQINLVLLVLVVGDLLTSGRSKWSGIGIGLAAGLKLTPALFIVYLLVTRRIRAAAVATGTFAATVALGFALAPKDSINYWLHGEFDDINRISHDPLANTSVGGQLLRLHASHPVATAAAAATAAVAVLIAAWAYRREQPVLALAIVGMASAAASPFSWSHHWVWFVPLVVQLGYRGYVVGSRSAVAAMWVVCAVVGGWIVSTVGGSPQAGVLSLRAPGIWNQILPGTYVLIFGVVVIATSVWLWRLRDDAPLTGATTHDLEHLESVDAGKH